MMPYFDLNSAEPVPLLQGLLHELKEASKSGEWPRVYSVTYCVAALLCEHPELPALVCTADKLETFLGDWQQVGISLFTCLVREMLVREIAKEAGKQACFGLCWLKSSKEPSGVTLQRPDGQWDRAHLIPDQLATIPGPSRN